VFYGFCFFGLWVLGGSLVFLFVCLAFFVLFCFVFFLVSFREFDFSAYIFEKLNFWSRLKFITRVKRSDVRSSMLMMEDRKYMASLSQKETLKISE